MAPTVSKLKYNSNYWKIAGLRPAIFRGTLGNWGIHNVNYGKIAGLTACYFQWNSWKLGASIIWVISKQWFYWSYTHKYPKNEIKQSVLNIFSLGMCSNWYEVFVKTFSSSRGRQNWLLEAFEISRALRALEISKLASRSQFCLPCELEKIFHSHFISVFSQPKEKILRTKYYSFTDCPIKVFGKFFRV